MSSWRPRLERVMDGEDLVAIEGERLDMAIHPGPPIHDEHGPHEVHAARAQGRHECPDRPALPAERIGPHAEAAIVDLHGLAEGGLGQEHGEPTGVDRADLFDDVPAEGRKAHGGAAGIEKALPDRGHAAGLERFGDLFVQPRERGARREASRRVVRLRGRGGERRSPLGRGPGRPLPTEASGLGLRDALAHGVARVSQAACDEADASAGSPVHQDLGVVLHGDPPAGHAFHLLSAEAGRADFRTTPGGSIP